MNKDRPIDVLLIEDDPMVQEVNRQFIEKVEGFQIAGVASNGADGMEKVIEIKPDLVLLDIYMPEKDGIETLQKLRQLDMDIDVIVITAANDRLTIRKMFQHGAIDYIIKPFKFERLERALNHYRMYAWRLSGEGELSQEQLDQWISRRNESAAIRSVIDSGNVGNLPKGLNEQTLKQIMLFLSEQEESVSAEETADGIGIARVTARRYLDYLQKVGKVKLDLQYGGVGRPLNRYILKSK
ncbi:two-component system response regulator DctR [Melghiribacillus thermohalophilus]|uniref:Two-component system response regulator DctR n=1 Tax=Melghiribacillus thermohalophilus TaxID=1324956 RepID=A0A4R3MWJ1_9BACI|nr:response regulator [Melghiribacillus thermohalophilus]TCT18274.1 two-component system response regulator DctR [Melghiribacillus thermohalophilus]